MGYSGGRARSGRGDVAAETMKDVRAAMGMSLEYEAPQNQ